MVQDRETRSRGGRWGRWLVPTVIILVSISASCDRPSDSGSGPALWRIEDRDSTIYLFGTVHVLPRGVTWFTPKIADALAESDAIYFETPTDAEAANRFAALVSQHGLSTTPLSQRLDPATRTQLERVARKVEADPAQLENARPWLAALRLSMAMLARQGHSQAEGVERQLEEKAAAAGKPTKYLETAEEQIRVFSELPPDAEMHFLKVTLRQIEEDSEGPNRLDRLWAVGDNDTLGRTLLTMIEEAGPQVADALIYERNERWAEEIDDVMAGSGTAFVAVGAAHMAGPRGLPALLRRKGHKVSEP